MSGEKLIIGVPSKGRLMEQTVDYFDRAGTCFPEESAMSAAIAAKSTGLPEVEVAYLSAARKSPGISSSAVSIWASPARIWCASTFPTRTPRCEFIARLGFGRADVVVAVPECWIDVETDGRSRDAAASYFHREHRRHLRGATKYMNLARGASSR